MNIFKKLKRYFTPAPFRVIQKWDGTYRAQRYIRTSRFEGPLYADIRGESFTTVYDADVCIDAYIKNEQDKKIVKQREEQYKLIAEVYDDGLERN